MFLRTFVERVPSEKCTTQYSILESSHEYFERKIPFGNVQKRLWPLLTFSYFSTAVSVGFVLTNPSQSPKSSKDQIIHIYFIN